MENEALRPVSDRQTDGDMAAIGIEIGIEFQLDALEGGSNRGGQARFGGQTAAGNTLAQVGFDLLIERDGGLAVEGNFHGNADFRMKNAEFFRVCSI